MQRVSLRLRTLPLAPLSLIVLGSSLWPEMELLVPSLPAMKAHFGVDEGQIQALLSTNFFGFIIGVLFAGPLCDAWGRKKICIIGAVLFLLASAAAPFATSLDTLLTIRFLQGLTMCGPIIAGSAMLLELTHGKAQIFWMATSSASISLCMAGAPLLGAVINSSFGFSANLWAIFIAGAIGIVPVMLFVPESLACEKRSPFKVSSVFAGYWQLLKNPRFFGLAIAISGLPAAFWVYSGVSSLYMVDHLQIAPELFGRYQGPIVGIFAVLSIAITRIERRLSFASCLIIGFLLMLVGIIALVTLSLAGMDSAVLTTIFMMFFVGGMVPVNALLFPSALNELPQTLQGSGQSMIQALRLTLAAIGTSILSFTYHGPFLPIALILAVTFIICWALVYKLRHSLVTPANNQVVNAGH